VSCVVVILQICHTDIPQGTAHEGVLADSYVASVHADIPKAVPESLLTGLLQSIEALLTTDVWSEKPLAHRIQKGDFIVLPSAGQDGIAGFISVQNPSRVMSF
jgi:hypothetical protein